MTCKVCGKELADGIKFCDNCGAKVEIENVETSETAETVETVEAAEPERVDAQIVSEGKKIENTYTESTYSQNASSDSNATYNSTATASNSNSTESKGFAIASLVCGIVSLLCCCCCAPIGFIVGGAGLGLGIYVLKKELPGKEMAIAGIVCGGIALAYTVFSIILGLIGVATPASKFDFEDIIDSLDL
ncbi:MAG: zinc-ribbon domain-containing protein [Lachnospiraceae bacterium]|nr:zinc-ribbon domain-containing protein [Lachnospiraceae bacterium]